METWPEAARGGDQMPPQSSKMCCNFCGSCQNVFYEINYSKTTVTVAGNPLKMFKLQAGNCTGSGDLLGASQASLSFSSPHLGINSVNIRRNRWCSQLGELRLKREQEIHQLYQSEATLGAGV